MSRNKKFEIDLLKSRLRATDYMAIKFFEGFLTEEEYAPIKAKRQAWRDKINALEEEIENENKGDEV